MAARLVWLVANGIVRPERVLGLTFTRKAAAELADRVRGRLDALRRAGLGGTGADTAGAGAEAVGTDGAGGRAAGAEAVGTDGAGGRAAGAEAVGTDGAGG